MKGKRIYLIIALSIVVSAILINTAYALTTSVSVDDNTVTASERSIDIKVNGEPREDPFIVTVPDFANVSTPVVINDNSLVITASDADDVKIRAWLYLNDPADWLIVDYVTLHINNNNYDFGIQTVNAQQHFQSFVPTDAITLAPDEYGFTLTFHFKGSVGEDLYADLAASFIGKMVFVMADDDPVPTPVPSP